MTMKIKNTFLYFTFVSIAIVVSSCGSSGDEGAIVSNDTAAVKTQERSEQTKKILSSIPSPVETVALLKTAGSRYNKEYLNSIDNVSKYSTSAAKAINLGVYGTDLSFTSIFDKTQETMLYLRCANTLSHEMNIMGVFDENTTARLEANQNDKDSLLSIISESFKIADTYLNNNGQPGLSTLIVAGAWVEGIYIATRVANDTKKEDVKKKLVPKKTTLEKLKSLLQVKGNESEDVKKVLGDLNALKKVFDGVTDTTLTADQLKQITTKVNEIRAKLIS